MDDGNGLGNVTRTPCDATIDINAECPEVEDISTLHDYSSSDKESKCCKSNSSNFPSALSKYQSLSQPLEYEHPPEYQFEESSSKGDDRSSNDSGLSNSKSRSRDEEYSRQGIELPALHRNEKLTTTIL